MAEMIAGAAAGPEYPKINGIWKRTDRGKVIIGEYATPELHFLRHSQWFWTEKIDGTNIRLHWDGDRLLIGGKSDSAQIPAPLYEYLQAFVACPWDDFDGPITVYGEGFGAGIQSGGQYGSEQRFIVFDVFIHDDATPYGGWWLAQNQVEAVATGLGLPTVSYMGTTYNLELAEEIVRGDQAGFVSAFDGVEPEGIVGRPAVPMFDRRGNRIMVKIKRKDYSHIKREEDT